MSIAITCPGCSKQMKVTDAMAGKRGKCPSCQSVIQVPALQGAGQAASSSAVGRQVAAPRSPLPSEHRDLGPENHGPAPEPAPVPASGMRPAAPLANPFPASAPSGDDGVPPPDVQVFPAAGPSATSNIGVPSGGWAGPAPLATPVPATETSPFPNPYASPAASPFMPGTNLPAVGYGGPAAHAHQLTRMSLPLFLLLCYLTFNIFGTIRLLLMHGQMPQLRSDDPSAAKAIGFCFIPFFNLFYWSFFVYGRLIQRINQQRLLRQLPEARLHGLAMTFCGLLALSILPFVGLLVSILTGYVLFPILCTLVQNAVNQLVDVTERPPATPQDVQRIIARNNRMLCLTWAIFLAAGGGLLSLGTLALAIAANDGGDGMPVAALATILAILGTTTFVPAAILFHRSLRWKQRETA